MLRSRQAGRALKALAESQACRQRTFTSSTKAPIVTAKRNGPAAARNQTTSATAKAPAAYVFAIRIPSKAVTHEKLVFANTRTTNSEVRPKPSPSFNAEANDHVQPLVGRKSDMDESYVVAVAARH